MQTKDYGWPTPKITALTWWNLFFERLQNILEGKPLLKHSRQNILEDAISFLNDAITGEEFIIEMKSPWNDKDLSFQLEAFRLALSLGKTGHVLKEEIINFRGYFPRLEEISNEEKRSLLDFFQKVSEEAIKENIYWRWPKPLEENICI